MKRGIKVSRIDRNRNIFFERNKNGYSEENSTSEENKNSSKNISSVEQSQPQPGDE